VQRRTEDSEQTGQTHKCNCRLEIITSTQLPRRARTAASRHAA
jgi:hypothetical protein